MQSLCLTSVGLLFGQVKIGESQRSHKKNTNVGEMVVFSFDCMVCGGYQKHDRKFTVSLTIPVKVFEKPGSYLLSSLSCSVA